jgi:hypothetical protein
MVSSIFCEKRHSVHVGPAADTWYMRIIDRLSIPVDRGHLRLCSTKEFRDMLSGAGLQYEGCRTTMGPEKVHIAEKVAFSTR